MRDHARLSSNTSALRIIPAFVCGFIPLLLVSLRYLRKPEELVWAASGFGGGLYHKDLCGFLAGRIMALGCENSFVLNDDFSVFDHVLNRIDSQVIDQIGISGHIP